ncbi:MAG: cytochrome P450 [Sphingomonadaceae bacterium]
MASHPHKIPDDIARSVVLASGYKDENIYYPAFRWLRENEPLGVAEVEGYDPLWLVTKNADIVAVEKDPGLFSSGDANPILSDQAGDALLKSRNNGSIRVIAAPTFMDPPEHGQYRTIMASWFAPGRVSKMAEQVREQAKRTVEQMMSYDGEVDFMHDIAHYYPLRVLMKQMGIPDEDEAKMLKLTQEFFGGHDPEEQREEHKVSEAVAAEQWWTIINEIGQYFEEFRRARRINPRDDFLSHVANARIDGEYLPDPESTGLYISIITAGHDTTSATASGGMLGMMRHPEQFAKVKANPALIPQLVEEAVRYTTVVKHFMRMATRDTELRGRKIKAGDRLMLCYPSGNRDEEVFFDPDRFEIERRPNRHVGFGGGPHMCVGQHLARLELKTLFEELLPRLESIELAGTPKFIETNYVGGLKSLPMRFKKA